MKMIKENVSEIKKLVSNLHCMGTYGMVELELTKIENYVKELENNVKQLTAPPILDEAIALLKEYEQWEAGIIGEDELWWPNTAQDVMRGKIYDTMIELQEKRNNLLKNVVKNQTIQRVIN